MLGLHCLSACSTRLHRILYFFRWLVSAILGRRISCLGNGRMKRKVDNQTEVKRYRKQSQ